MNYFDLLAWVCAPSGTDALEIWKHCNPDKSQIWYTFDPTIKAFWKSRIGQATLWGNRPRREILQLLSLLEISKVERRKNIKNDCLSN